MYNVPDLKDKILCAVLYSSIFVPFMTWAPIIWIVVANLRKIYLKDFIKYHCYQAVLFNMILFFLPSLVSKLIQFINAFLDLFGIFQNSIEFLSQTNSFVLSIYAILTKVLSLYAIVWTFRGKYTYIPPISQAVNLLLR